MSTESDFIISPAEAKVKSMSIRADMNSDYWNPKATPEARNRCIFLVNRLEEIAASGKPANISNDVLLPLYEKERMEKLKDQYQTSDPYGKNRKSAYGTPNATYED